MNGQKIFFAANLKFLRERRKLSQETLADSLNLTRAKLAALEVGNTKTPQLEDLVAVSEYFKISVDSLLKVNLSKLLELQLRDLEAGNDVYMMGSKIRILATTVDGDNRQNCEYVPVKAKMGYTAGHADPQYVAALPKYNIPSLPGHGTYRTFPASGDSMYPVPDKAEVTGVYVEDWTSLKPDTPAIVVLKNSGNGDDIVFKLVSVGKHNTLRLKSLNPAYQPYMVEAENVLEIWKFVQLHVDTLPEPPDTDLQQLKAMVGQLNAKVQQLSI